MSMIEAVIFDWAGTTVDYGCFAPVHAFLKAFEKFQIVPTMEEIRKPMGMLKIDHIRTMLQMDRINGLWKEQYQRDFNEKDVQAIYEVFEESLLGSLKDFASPKEGVIETVEALREQGIKIGSTTGYTDIMMEIVTKSAKEQGYVPDFWISPDSVQGAGRPYPYMIFENMKKLKISSVHHVIKVGDTISDIKEGKNAGVISAAVIIGSSELGCTKEEFEVLNVEDRQKQIQAVRKRFIEAGADFVFDDIRELLGIIKTIS